MKFHYSKWFGLPESTQKYVQDGTKLPLWAAYEDHEAVAFTNLTNSSKDCGVIHCMGVKKAHHRKGIGRLLIEALEEEARQDYSYPQVKTVDEGHYKEYDQTVSFYKSCGFVKLEVFPTLWEAPNSCLVMIKKL